MGCHDNILITRREKRHEFKHLLEGVDGRPPILCVPVFDRDHKIEQASDEHEQLGIQFADGGDGAKPTRRLQILYRDGARPVGASCVVEPREDGHGRRLETRTDRLKSVPPTPSLSFRARM